MPQQDKKPAPASLECERTLFSLLVLRDCLADLLLVDYIDRYFDSITK
jgi:hypothetical protein